MQPTDLTSERNLEMRPQNAISKLQPQNTITEHTYQVLPQCSNLRPQNMCRPSCYPLLLSATGAVARNTAAMATPPPPEPHLYRRPNPVLHHFIPCTSQNLNSSPLLPPNPTRPPARKNSIQWPIPPTFVITQIRSRRLYQYITCTAHSAKVPYVDCTPVNFHHLTPVASSHYHPTHALPSPTPLLSAYRSSFLLPQISFT